MSLYNIACAVYAKHYFINFIAIFIFINLAFSWFSFTDEKTIAIVNGTILGLHIIIVIIVKTFMGKSCNNSFLMDEIKDAKRLIREARA